MTDSNLMVIVRDRPSLYDGGLTTWTKLHTELARDAGSFKTTIATAYSDDNNIFAITNWSNRASANQYVESVLALKPGAIINADRTEFCADPVGPDRGSFHAIILAH